MLYNIYNINAPGSYDCTLFCLSLPASKKNGDEFLFTVDFMYKTEGGVYMPATKTSARAVSHHTTSSQIMMELLVTDSYASFGFKAIVCAAGFNCSDIDIFS